MDNQGFSRPTLPNLFHRPAFGTEYNIVRQEQTLPKTLYSVHDSRYPAYAGRTEDGRVVTDYRPHCYQNTSPGAQFTTKKWMIHHADSIMDLSRRRQVEWTGASLPLANTVPPPAQIVHSTPFENQIQASGAQSGIGLERADARSPFLFGTFVYPPTREEILNNTKNIGLTMKSEGGRNAMRGASPQYLS